MKLQYTTKHVHIKIENIDWRYWGREVNTAIKSMPKSKRRFDWNEKEWIVERAYFESVRSTLPIIYEITPEEWEYEGREFERTLSQGGYQVL